MIGFFEANDCRFNMSDDVLFADSIAAVPSGTETEEEFAERTRLLIERVDLRGWE